MKQGEREHGTEKETGYRKHRRRQDHHLFEEVQEVNSAAEWKTRCGKGRDWTGNRLLGESNLSLAALMATTLYVLMAFPWQLECLHPFTLLSECLFRQRAGCRSCDHLGNRVRTESFS